MVQGVTASLQEGNLSLHFKCAASLHHRLLSLLFLFNNLITSPDLIFFPQMSLQRFMPMNIHSLLKNLVPLSQGRCSSAAGSGGVPTSWGDSQRGEVRALGWEERGSQSWAHCLSTSPSSPHNASALDDRQRSWGLWAAAEMPGIGVVGRAGRGGNKSFLPGFPTALPIGLWPLTEPGIYSQARGPVSPSNSHYGGRHQGFLTRELQARSSRERGMLGFPPYAHQHSLLFPGTGLPEQPHDIPVEPGALWNFQLPSHSGKYVEKPDSGEVISRFACVRPSWYCTSLKVLWRLVLGLATLALSSAWYRTRLTCRHMHFVAGWTESSQKACLARPKDKSCDLKK